MYSVLQTGMVWGYVGTPEGQVVFVDKQEELFGAKGILLPRFKVKLREFYYRRILTAGYNAITDEFVENIKACSMNVIHGVEYAGLAQNYTWHFTYDQAMTAQTWAYNGKKNPCFLRAMCMHRKTISFSILMHIFI